MSAAARDLTEALAQMSWSVEPGHFVLVGFPEGPVAEDLASLVPPGQLIVEEGETSLLVRPLPFTAEPSRRAL